VALLVPPPHSLEIDGLRRALGSSALARIAPHLTLVPPVNVRAADVAEALRVLRDAAAATKPFRVRLGPAVSFAPVTPTVHLAVTAPDEGIEAVRRLHDLVSVEPLARVLTHGFEPHVTLDDDVEPDRVDSICRALGGYVVEVWFDRLHLLQEEHRDTGRRWVPVADVPFGPAVVVGRGGVELELITSDLVDPEAQAFLAAEGHLARVGAEDSVSRLVITARRRGAVVGVVAGDRAAAPDWPDLVLVVASDQRGQGIAGQLRRAFTHAGGGGG